MNVAGERGRDGGEIPRVKSGGGFSSCPVVFPHSAFLVAVTSLHPAQVRVPYFRAVSPVLLHGFPKVESSHFFLPCQVRMIRK